MRRFLHLIRGPAPDILRNDRRTRATRFLQFLCLAMTPDHTQAKEAVTWAETCLRDWRRHEAEQDWPALDATGKSRFILSLIEKVIDDLAPHDDAPWHLGFSSGLDSRLLHHVLRRKGVAFQPYTYGQPGNLDFDFSKLADTHLGMTTLFFDTTTLDWSTERVDRMTAQVRDRPTSPRALCAQELCRRSGRPIVDVHGFLNGYLTGSLQSRQGPTEDWPSIVGHEVKANDQFGFQAFIRPDIPRSFFPEAPISDVLPLDRQLGLAYRQWQRIRPGDLHGVTYVCPYTDPRWVGFWLSRSSDELSGQKLYVDALLSARMPEFFDLTHLADEGHEPTKKNRIERVYGTGRKRLEFAQRQGVQAPLAPTSHFCAFACYWNNPAFTRYVDQSLRRLRARRLFHESFIDDVSRRFTAGDKPAEKLMKGLLSIDSCMESALLD